MGLSIGDIQLGITIDKPALSGALNSAKGDISSWASGVEGSFGSIGKNNKIGDNLLGSLSNSKGKFGSIGTEIGSSLSNSIGGSFGALGGIASSAAAALGPIGIAAGVVAAGLALIGGASIAAASAWQTGMAGVSKTTGLAGAELTILSNSLLEMSTRMPVAASGLQQIAGVAGSLGVGKDQIAGFTEAASMMAVGFEMSAEVAATSAAKILTSFGKPIDTSNMMALGNVVNSMGDNFAATEPQVLDFINRASFLNTTMGMGIPDVAALGTTLISVGLDAEVAANGIKSALNMGMSETSKTGGLVNWAKLMGVSVDELKQKVGTDLSGTMVETANKIASMEDPVLRFQTAVALFGTEGAPAVLKLAGQADNLNKALTAANSEWANGSSLQKTYTAQSETLASRFSILSNTINMVMVSVGTPMLPWISGAVNALQGLVVVAFKAGAALVGIVANSNAFQAFSAAISGIGAVVGTTFGNFVSLVKPAWDALGGGNAVLGALQQAFNVLTAPITLVFTALGTVVSVLGKVESALTPVASAIGGALGTAIKTTSAYVTAFIEAFSNLGPIKALGDALQGASDIAGRVWDGLKTAVPNAFSGAFEAVKVLITGFISWVGDSLGMGDIGSKITTGIKDSLGEGITGWIGSISGRANEILGAGTEAGDNVADGVDQSKLKSQAAETIARLEEANKIEEAGKKAGELAAKAFADSCKAYTDKYGSGITAGFTSREIDFMSEYTDEWNRMWEASNQATEEGTEVQYGYIKRFAPRIKETYRSAEVYNKQFWDVVASTADDSIHTFDSFNYAISDTNGTIEGLYNNLRTSFNMSEQEAAAAIQNMMEYDQATSYAEKTFRTTFATSYAGWKQNHADLVMAEADTRKFIAAWEAAPEAAYKLKIFNTWIAGLPVELRAAGQMIGPALAESIMTAQTMMGEKGKDLMETVLKGMADPNLAGYTVFQDTLAQKVKDGMPQATATTTGAKYMMGIAAGIVNGGTYVTTEMGRIAEAANSALSDGFLSVDDNVIMSSLRPQLEYLKVNFPAEFEAIGGDVVIALVEGIQSGDIAGPAAAKAKEGIDAIKATLSEGVSLENFGNLGEQYYNLAKAMGTKWTLGMQEDADASMAEYKARLGGAITDTQAFAEDAMSTAGGLASKAFSDHVFTTEDLASLQNNLLPILEMVEEKSPEYFESAAGKAWLAFAEAIKSGDPDEIYETYEKLGKGSGDSFLSGVKKSVSLQEIYNILKADPSKLKTVIADPIKFAWSDGIDEAKKIIDARREELSKGYILPDQMKAELLLAFSPLETVLPGWVNEFTDSLANNSMTLETFVALFDLNYAKLEEYRKGTDASTKSTEKSTTATKDKTKELDLNRLSLSALNAEMSRASEFSGVGLSITFSPARVIADEAKNALILGAQTASGFLSGGGDAVKIGFDQWGREVAVIGRVEQERWAKNGQLVSANLKTSSDDAATTTKTAATDGKGIHIAAMTEGGVLFLQKERDTNAEDKIAHGQVNQDFTTKFSMATSSFLLGVGGAISNLAQKLGLAGDSFFNRTSFAGLDLSNKTTSAATIAYGKQINAADYGLTKSFSGANLLQTGCQIGANALTGAASSIKSAGDWFARNMSGGFPKTYSAPTGTGTGTGTGNKGRDEAFWTNLGFDDLGKFGSSKGPTPQYATGTKTSGPHLAMIGEDGAAYPEFVIPTKTKRWDLLRAANKAYGAKAEYASLFGIPGYAEGTTTGTAGGAPDSPGDAAPLSATFGITGLAAMSSQVKRIINDLKDFFRISWGIVKSEGAKYWKQINVATTTEVTSIRDAGWQAALDIRNAWINGNVAVLADAKTFWAAYWPAIEPSVTSLKTSLIYSFQEVNTGAKTAIDSMVLNSESSLQAFQTAWQDIWTQLVTDMSAAQTQISAGVAAIAADLRKISVNVNISGGGGSYGGSGGSGGSGGGETDGVFGGWLDPTGDWSEYTTTTIGKAFGEVSKKAGFDVGSLLKSTFGTLSGSSGGIQTGTVTVNGGAKIQCAGGCEDFATASIESRGPLWNVPGTQSGSSSSSGSSGYSLPAVFRARGALEDQGARQVVVGEAGPELILPAKFTQLFTAMADQFGASPEDEFASLFGDENDGTGRNAVRSGVGGSISGAGMVQLNPISLISKTISDQFFSQKSKSVSEEFASLFSGEKGTPAPLAHVPSMILPAKPSSQNSTLATGSQGGANIENLLEKLLKAVETIGVDVFIDSDKVGAKIMKKIQRKQGASF
jgi:TP901 family phage tail tape measure protein